MINLIKNALKYFNIRKRISKTNISENLEEISFPCDHCLKVITSDDLVSALFSYGLIFLIGKDDGYFGIVCPECQKTTLIQADRKTIESLKDQLSSKVGYTEGSKKPRLRYFSFPYTFDYHTENLPSPIASYIKPLAEGSDSLKESEVSHLFPYDSNSFSEGYCSYFFGDLAIGPCIAVWWFQKKDIEALVKIENKARLKVFPRYIAYDPLYKIVGDFCWKYFLKSYFIKVLDLSVFPEMEVEEAKLETASYREKLTKEADFLRILIAMPGQSNFYSRAEKGNSREDIIDELWDNFHDKAIQKYLSHYSYKFIFRHIQIAQNIDFSIERVWEMNDYYFRDLYEIMENRRNKNIPSIESFHVFSEGPDKEELIPEDQFKEFKDRLEGLEDLLVKVDPLKAFHSFCITSGWGRKIQLSVLPSKVKAVERAEKRYEKQLNDRYKTVKTALKDISERLSIMERRFPDLKQIVTQNRQLMELKYKVAEVAKFDTDILVVGETGTGKELFARAIHQASERKGKFVPINCSGIQKDLFESELFGHKKGSFTGAIADKMGVFEYANNGTLFLDELGEMPIELQPKILRALEYREVKPVGSSKSIKVDAKLVFATNRDLRQEVESGNFRKDLFFRIFSPSFRIIPLKARAEDIPLLADHFRDQFNTKFNKRVESISPSVIKKLKEYSWEGNVRELMKVMEMAVINSDGSKITDKELPDFIRKDKIKEEPDNGDDSPAAMKITDEEILYWMRKLNNNKTKVAEKLGVTYRTILRRCKNLGI